MAIKGTLPRGFRCEPEQASFRKSEVVRLLTEEHCTPPQIAAAMRPVVNESTVRKDAHEAGIRWARHTKPVAPDPPPVDWLHPPVAQAVPADRAAAALRRFLDEMKAARGVQAHAHDLLEARLDGDQKWEAWWAERIRRLRQIADDLGRLHTDRAFLRATALGRVQPGQPESERVDERGQRSRSVVQPVIHVMDDVRGARGLGGDVEDDKNHECPAEDFPKHSSRVTLHWPSVDGVRV
jgi:hypothetical protein